MHQAHPTKPPEHFIDQCPASNKPPSQAGHPTDSSSNTVDIPGVCQMNVGLSHSKSLAQAWEVRAVLASFNQSVRDIPTVELGQNRRNLDQLRLRA